MELLGRKRRGLGRRSSGDRPHSSAKRTPAHGVYSSLQDPERTSRSRLARSHFVAPVPPIPVNTAGMILKPGACPTRPPAANSFVFELSFTAAGGLFPVHAILTGWPRVQRQQTPCKAD